MGNYNSWRSEDRYYDICPMCRTEITSKTHGIVKKADTYTNKKLTRLCKNCYLKVLDFIGISDIELY